MILYVGGENYILNSTAADADVFSTSTGIHQYNTRKRKKTSVSTSGNSTLIEELSLLENVPFIENKDVFECAVCFNLIQLGLGVTLKECLHLLCKNCLEKLVLSTEEAFVGCPHLDDTNQRCIGLIQEREIKAIVAEHVYEKYLEKSIRIAESTMENSSHCKTPNCRGWCTYEHSPTVFMCPVCTVENCLKCRVIHKNLSCNEYQERLICGEQSDITEKILKVELEERKIMHCPTCQTLIEKETGCDGIICTICHTALCWATRGPRWGPKGKGDTSAGCRCNIKKCHPSCKGCH